MNALPMKNTRQSKEVVGKMLQRHDLRLFGSTNTDTWKENTRINLKNISSCIINTFR
jgi:hypothetical protein